MKIFSRSDNSKLNPYKKFKQESTLSQLTIELENHYDQVKQLEATYTLKWKLCQDLFSMFAGIIPSKCQSFCTNEKSRDVFSYSDIGIYLVGSSANGFANEDTDADICIVISPYPVGKFEDRMAFTIFFFFFEIDQKREAVKFLEMLRRALRKKISSLSFNRFFY